MSHSWCRDIPRDEAVRAAEDNRSGPLPTLESVIAEPFAEPAKCSPAVSESGKGQSGLRTERVTLEITHDLDAPLGDWIVQVIDESLGYDESVRVVDEVCPDAWAQTFARLESDRDAVIRERDELRSQVQILDEGQPTAPSDLGVWCTAKDLSARCKELAARLVTTAVRASSAETALREIFAQDYARSSVNGASWKMHDIAEKALKSALAASGAAGTEPVAWGIANPGNPIYGNQRVWTVRATEEIAKDVYHSCDGWVHFPLYAAPQAASGWLTEEERSVLETMRDELKRLLLSMSLKTVIGKNTERDFVAIESILDRSSPPEVVLPISLSPIDEQLVIEALAAAGVKVKEPNRE